MRLAPNFTTHEMVGSSRHPELETPWASLEATPASNLTRLVLGFLQPVRDSWGRVEILSGYRGLDLNRAVGGVDNSRHLLGLAADWIPRDQGATAAEVYRWCALKAEALEFDRLCIYTGLDPMTLHVDLRLWEEGPPRRRFYRDSPWRRVDRDGAVALVI